MDSLEKKRRIRAYKESTPPMGIYQIKNTRNNKIYIGSTLNIKGRLNRIQFQLQMGSYPHKEIQADYNRFGKQAFLFEVLDYLQPRPDTKLDYAEELKILEEMWLDKLNPFGERGYNTSPKKLEE